MTGIVQPPDSAPCLRLSLASVIPEAIEARGLSAEQVWRALGQSEPPFNLSEWVAVHEVAQALELAKNLTADSSVALDAALRVRPRHLGNLGYALFSSEQGLDGLLVYESLQSLLCNGIVSQHAMQGDQFWVLHRCDESASPHLAQFWWFLIGARLAFARWVTGMPLHPLQIDIPTPQPDDPSPFERFVGCPVRYNTDVCAEWLPREWLSWINPNGDSHLHQLMRQKGTEELSTQLPRQDRVLAQARFAVMQQLENGGDLTLDTIVASLNKASLGPQQVSARELQRRLTSVDLHYKDLLDEVKRDRALRLLRETNLSVLQIALSCGYTEVSPFHRAVKRWVGLTPKAYRDQK